MNHLILMSLECFHIELSVVDYLSWSAYSSAVKFRTVSDDPMQSQCHQGRSVSGSLVVYLTVHGHMVNPLSYASSLQAKTLTPVAAVQHLHPQSTFS